MKIQLQQISAKEKIVNVKPQEQKLSNEAPRDKHWGGHSFSDL